jgi:hypothetical protein
VTDPRLGGIAQQLQPDTKTRHERRERARDLDRHRISHALPSP